MNDFLPEESRKYKLSSFQINFFRDNPNVEWPLCECGCGKKVLLNITDKQEVFRRFASVECSRSSKTVSKDVISLLSNSDWLYEQRYTLKKSKESIAKELGISTSPVYKWCKIHHFIEKKRNANFDGNINMELVKKLYIDENKTILDISKELGNISKTTLKKKMIECGIELRSHSDNQKGRSPFIGKTKEPVIKIDRKELVRRYTIEKIPMSILADEYECHEETIRRFLKQENVDISHRRSNIEHIIKNTLDDIGVVYKMNDRKIIRPYEVDFLLPDHKIGIEAHGLYHHSYYGGKKDKNYHNMKYLLGKEKGIKIFQFYENDILEKTEIIKSMIKNACKMTDKRIYARKCQVEIIDNSILNEFCYANHLIGKTSSSSKGIGLYYDNELVSVIGYYQTKNDKVITRFCSKINHNVVGAFSKLISKIDGQLRTYSTNDTGDGELYSSNGFTCVKVYKYDLWYTDYDIIYNRQKFMKNKIKDIFSTYDNNKTEIDNMIDNGYDAIFKSGTKTWIRK